MYAPFGWQAVQANEPAECSPADGWRNVDGLKYLMVWHDAQLVRPP